MTEPKVDDLFRWYKPVNIGGRQIWMRTLSATDDTERMRSSLFAARRKRSKLMEDGTPEREDLLAVYGSIGREELLVAIRVFRINEAQGLVGNEVHPKEDPPVPEDGTLESAMDAGDKLDEQLAELVKRKEEWISEHVNTIMLIHEKEDDETLRKKAIEMQINVFCTEAYAEAYNRESISRSCYRDKKFSQRLFASAGEAGELGPAAFKRLVNEYYELDKFSLAADSLKN